MWARSYFPAAYWPAAYWPQGAESEGPEDPYLALGWAPRDFYVPYWMGLALPEEVEAKARQRARETRIRWGIVPPDAAAVIEPIAARQAREDVDEFGAIGELLNEFDRKRVEWRDHYAGYLAQLRQEMHAAEEQRKQAEQARAKMDARQQERARHAAKLEIARRERLRLKRQRQRKDAALVLLMSYA